MRRSPGWPPSLVGIGLGALLFLLATQVPRWTHQDVLVGWPPLAATWQPRVNGFSVLAVLLGGVLVIGSPWAARRLRWSLFVGLTWSATAAWTVALAWVDGSSGLGNVFSRPHEYAYDASRVTSIHAMLTGFISRIPADAPHNWQTHVAGHPAGALLVFVGFDRLGIHDSLVLGLVVTAIGSTAVIAGCLAVRAVAGEQWARRAAPWWVLSPAALWMGVSADAMYTAVAAWGLALLALAGTRQRGRASTAYAVGAGLVLGCCVYLSYGLVLLGILALAVLVATRSWRPLVGALGGALAVVAAFTLAGFSWWAAYPVLVERYNAYPRPYSYWVWANVAAWTAAAGLAVWAALPAAVAVLRGHAPSGAAARRVALVGCAGVLTVLVATGSGMSNAEVERIWLPFTFWATLLPALLTGRRAHVLLGVQAATALVLQHLLRTGW